MRTLSLILLFLFLAVPAVHAQDAPPQEKKPEGVAPDEALAGPFGEIHMTDGRGMEISKLKRFGKYYIYISGKLNGRASTVISLTRLSDIRHWAAIVFKDENTFTIHTKNKKELNFQDGHVYLGSDSPTDYTFVGISASSYAQEEMSVKKPTVKAIVIN